MCPAALLLNKDFGPDMIRPVQHQPRIVTKDISRDNGQDLNRREELTKTASVANGQLTVNVGKLRKFTLIEFSLVK